MEGPSAQESYHRNAQSHTPNPYVIQIELGHSNSSALEPLEKQKIGHSDFRAQNLTILGECVENTSEEVSGCHEPKNTPANTFVFSDEQSTKTPVDLSIVGEFVLQTPVCSHMFSFMQQQEQTNGLHCIDLRSLGTLGTLRTWEASCDYFEQPQLATLYYG